MFPLDNPFASMYYCRSTSELIGGAARTWRCDCSDPSAAQAKDQPIYTQLIQQVTLAILSGTFPCGGRLPPVREMAAEAGVNPNTMQRALAELERTGLVYTQRTAGRFVTEDAAVVDSAKQELAHQQIGAFLHRMERMGYDREQTAQLVRSWEEDA